MLARKVILTILGFLIVLGSIHLSMYLINNKNKPKSVTSKVIKAVFVDTVQNSTIPIVISASGNLVAKRRVELFSEVQGVFKSTGTLFKPGQSYRQGQALIRIDASEYYASVQSAKSNLYNNIVALMPDLRLDYPDQFEKWQQYVSNFDINKTTPALPEITSDQENYFITGRGIVSEYYNVKNLEQRLSKFYINAPFTGVLIEALVTEGSLVRNGQKLGEFIDTSAYEMEVAVTKTYASFLKVGESVDLKSLDGTQYYKGKVSRINGSVDVTTQTVTAFIEVSDKDLKEGLYLEVNLNARDEPNAIEIDRNLLLENNKIFVVRDSILEIIEVNPVYFSDSKVVLKSVPDGTVILAKPVPGAYSGMLVESLLENKTE